MKSDRKNGEEGKTRERNGGRPLRVGDGSLKKGMFGCFLSLQHSDVDLSVFSKESVSLCISSS